MASARTASGNGAEDAAGAAEEYSISRRLATLRQEHRYSIRKLADRAGVSASLISDVERGKVEPSISTLKRLSEALGTTLTYFFSEGATQEGRVVRAGERVVLDGGEAKAAEVRSAIESGGIRFELASPDQAENIEAIYGRYEPGASLGGEPVTHEGEEWGMVISGRLKVWVGDEIYFLDPGDAIWYPSTIPHRMANVADGPTEYIWIDTPKSF
ncbi:MAG: cupin domain-containing protein [Solirubrobacterales bacterium]